MDALKALRTSGTPGMEGLHVGIGINSGQVTVGNLGTDTFTDYTAIGDAVNLASRLESLNKHYGSPIIVGEATVARLDDRFVTRKLDRVRVVGRDEPVDIYELVDYRSECESKDLDRIERYESALAAYQAGNLETAREILDTLTREQPDDIPTRRLLERVVQQDSLPEGVVCQPVTEFSIK
jgi:adenylate cyclase